MTHKTNAREDEKIVPGSFMKWNSRPDVLLVFCASALWWGQQRDVPSAFDRCRIVTTTDLTDKQAPGFASYPAAVPPASKRVKLDLKSSPAAKMYRTVLRREVAQGPNFAGHYRVAAWGCGSSCTMFVIVNLNTGRVIRPEGFSITSGVYFGVDDQKALPGSQSEYWLLAFRKDSKLIAVLGDLDEDEDREGIFYFVLDHERLRLIHSTRVTKDCESLRDKR